jgi:hypothetical protein
MSPQFFVPALAPAVALAPAALRHLAAALLQGASQALARAAQRIAMQPDKPPPVLPAPQLEFHAEAGAPEGALYADGVLIAKLPGVSRL